jgi:hypothetical protein
MNNVIECNGFKARIMEADRLVGSEQFGLPPGKPLPTYKVSSFKKRPDNWMVAEGSVVVPVKANKGLWFDWTLNDQENTAVLPSVKGCNPITGQQIDGFTLESYQTKCPVHGVDFEKDRYCPECGYKWASQNYVTAPNYLWWDGFRDASGTVRQFFFTEDMMRDVASQKLGSENTVPAFGFAFYTPIEKHMSVIYDKTTGTFRTANENPYKTSVVKGKLGKPIDVDSGTTLSSMLGLYSQGVQGMSGAQGVQGVAGRGFSSSMKRSKGVSETFYCCASAGVGDSNVTTLTNSISSDLATLGYKATSDSTTPDMACFSSCVMEDSYEEKQRGLTLYSNDEIKVKEVAVGAGAVIKQELAEDKYGISTWKNAPDAVMRVYFVFQDEFDKWASHGFVGESGSMLSGLPVG